MARPRALLFDWDNTLVDTWPAIRHAMNATLEAMGMPAWSLEETKARVRASARDAFPGMFGARVAEATEIFYRTFEADHLEKLRERPGASAMLRHLAENGFYLGVVSNKQGYLLRREAAHLGWSAWLRALVGATDAARDKPAVDPVDLALAGSGVARGAGVWFVGDTDIDMHCAVNAGCVPVLLRDEPPRQAEFPRGEPEFYVASCQALVELLLNP